MILGAAFRVHTGLGPGLLESAYLICLAFELREKGLFVEVEKPIPLIYKDMELNCGYRLDMVVEKSIVLEIKSVETLLPIHTAQLLTYLKLSGYHLGLLLNFNVELLKHGIRRVINGYRDPQEKALCPLCTLW